MGYVKSDKTINLQSAYHHAKGCKAPAGVCTNSNTSTRCLADSISREMRLLTTQQTLSKPGRLLSSLGCLLNSPHRFSRSLFPFPSSNALFILMFTGFLPSCAWSIKHTCACSLTSPSPRLVPEAKLWAHAELMKQHRWMAFSNWEKMTTIQAISRLRELFL